MEADNTTLPVPPTEDALLCDLYAIFRDPKVTPSVRLRIAKTILDTIRLRDQGSDVSNGLAELLKEVS